MTVFKVLAALIIAAPVFVIMLAAVMTLVIWLALGAGVWLAGLVAGISRPDAGRRLRSRGLRLLRSGPSRWMIKAAMHRARRVWNRQESSHKP